MCFVASLLAGGILVPTPAAADDVAMNSYQNMYRLYNPNTGEHFYTSSLDETVSVAEAGWQYEGVGWVAPTEGDPVFRLYNPVAGDHHYTLSSVERDWLVAEGWSYEGVGWYSGGTVAVLRQYNPNSETGTHNFTTSAEENSKLISDGWTSEGIGWYAVDAPVQTIGGRWIKTAAWGSSESYWLGSDASIAKDRMITLEEGAGRTAYATSTGAILRGGICRDSAGQAYLADDNGVLTAVTSEYARVVETYVNFMLEKAANNTFGYDQVYRWGEKGDYDCSSLVISAIRSAGVGTNTADDTHNMLPTLTQAGFVWIQDLSDLRYGDILLNVEHHTAVYLGRGLIVHASGNEYGRATGGRPGDQTGKEICVRTYYNYPWDGILRYNG